MVADAKQHKKNRKKIHPRLHPNRNRKLQLGVELQPSRPPVTPEEVAKEELLSKDDEEPKEEDLAKEEPIKPEEIEGAVAVEPEPEETGNRRERSAYDGDTAIKLYLREIG